MSDDSQHPERGYPNIDRPRGIFTPTDREVLVGDKEYESEQGLRNARYRLREHVRESLLDIFLMSSYFEQDELVQVLQRQSKLDDEAGRPRLLISAALVRLGFRIEYEDSKSGGRDFTERVEDRVQGAFATVYEQLTDDIVREIDVDITLETQSSDSDELLEHLVFGEPSMATVLSYLRNGDVQLLRDKLLEHGEEIDHTNEARSDPIGPDSDLLEIHILEEEDSD